jgi:proline racemase
MLCLHLNPASMPTPKTLSSALAPHTTALPAAPGTSAKIACLAASGELTEGGIWHQASIIGSVFEGSFESIPDSDKIIPIVTGRAFITAETTIIIHPNDPLKHGISNPSPQIGVLAL